MTAFIDVSLPTGSASNGATSGIVTPTLAYGKGFGPVDVQGTFGVALPTANVNVVGRTYSWNNAVQYQLTVGVGVQIAVSQFRTSKRNPILSVRLPF